MPILLLLLLWPMAEIFAAYLVADATSVFTMLGLVALASFGGLVALRSQSRSAWRQFNSDVSRRRMPSREVGDGLLGFAGGVLLLIPGLISGAIGALLLLPPTKALARWLVAVLVIRRFGIAGSAASWGYAYTTRPRASDYDVTGTAEEIPAQEIEDRPANDPVEPAEPPDRRPGAG